VKLRITVLSGLLAAVVSTGAGHGAAATPPTIQCAPAAGYPAAATPVAFWSTEARCAIVPAGPGGVFGTENFGNKFPGEGAVYMGIAHVAIYDAVMAIEGGYRPYATTPTAPANTSPEATIATAAYDTLTGLQPQLGASQTILDRDYSAYMATIPDATAAEQAAKQNGIDVGQAVAQAVLVLRVDDGRGCATTLRDLGQPAPGPGVWQPNPTGAVLGLCLPGMRPLALRSAWQFRPDGPNALTSQEYADDVDQVEDLGRVDSTTRSPDQTNEARLWTGHDNPQWNDGLLELAHDQGLDLVQSARMLAMPHVALLTPISCHSAARSRVVERSGFQTFVARLLPQPAGRAADAGGRTRSRPPPASDSHQEGQFSGAGASILLTAPVGTSCTTTVRASSVPSFRIMWTSPPPTSTKPFVPLAEYTFGVQDGSSPS
jgi:hypothetical protein